MLVRLRQMGIRMPEERYRYVRPDGYDHEGVPRYNNHGVQQTLRHFSRRILHEGLCFTVFFS